MPRPFSSFEPHGGGGPRIREIPFRMLIPNLITVLAICAGLSGIRLAFEDRFETAVVMVLIAAFLDGIDGRLARALKATSRFGAQMDSLADIVNFGAAPALVTYAFLLDGTGPFGWMAALIFTIACGLRLARFNVLDEDDDRPAWQAEYFVGVPAPAGALLVLLPTYLVFNGVVPGPAYAYGSVVFTLLVALLLVSRLPVWSAKTMGKRIPRDAFLPIILGVMIYVLLLVNYPWVTLTVSALAYLVFLPFSARAYTLRSRREQAAEVQLDPIKPYETP
ncbi:CDP-alcohol phosphatidyltransferase family protein [Arvimicrobium flavum]|uniref:CDP-alcohol phosphatidyltransferase family protein n=1 Tax=Arvimicrobium flavum TaxID=3393320 RepID=UPI00237A5566|nr:phosphatidylcholine/phosphatidylserine synthase [Mesorhizobium shangrilense]